MFGLFKKEPQWILDERKEQDRIVAELKAKKEREQREIEIEEYKAKQKAEEEALIERISEAIREDVSFLKGTICLDSENNLYIYKGFGADSKEIRFSRDYVQHFETDMTSIRTFPLRDETSQNTFCAGLKTDRYRWIKFKKQIEGFGIRLESNSNY